MRTDRTPSIDLEVRPVLSYAMAHNGIPVVSRLVVDGVDQDVPGAVVTVQLADATGAIGPPEQIALDLHVGSPAVLDDLGLTLDPAAMLQIEEQRPATVRARLEVDGRVCAERVAPVRLLAAHQWLADPLDLALEMLPAHVVPNHPLIADLLREAASVLERRTADPSLEGYQSGPERVDAIVDSVVSAMQARRIGYSMPPASWADDGQKIRTPSEVLDGRLGTCLDTTVVLAAALEAAWIRPLLWVIDGHAFLGYWREEGYRLPSPVETDAAGLISAVDAGIMRLVETTMLVDGPELASPSEIRAAARARLAGDLSNVLGVVDVFRARGDGTLPLPARVRDDDGVVRVTTYTPATPAVALPAPRPSQPGVRTRTAPTEPPRVTRWKNTLLDLSLRNRLVNFTDRAGLAVVLPAGGAGALEDLLHQGTAITLRASDEISRVAMERGARSAHDLEDPVLAELLRADRAVHVDVTAAGYPSRLRGLAHKARTITEESGANNLYLALGTLVWEIDKKVLRSPLILVPVGLKPARRGGDYRLTLDDAGSSTPNYCLVEKLRQTHGLSVPGLSEPVEDGAGIDLDAAFEAVRRAIAERGLNFRVEPTADLAILEFAKFRLWKDLDENWSAFAANPLVAHLMHTPTEPFADPVPDPGTHDLDGLDEQCPVVADGSQLRAVADAVAGRTFVLEGPPGTGKSQTITNLLAHAVAEGRRVLFVAEKRAALDVVARRLDAVGLGPLSLDLHDKGSKPAVVRHRIAAALDHLAPADAAEHEARVEEMRAARRALTRYAYRMQERNAAGTSLYEARLGELAYADADELPVPDSVPAGPAGTADELRRLFARLPEVTDAARLRAGHPWSFVDSVSGTDAAAIGRAAARFDAAIPRLSGRLRPALDVADGPAELDLLGRLVALRIPLPVLDEVRTRRWSDAVDRVLGELDRFRAEQHPALVAFGPAALDLPLTELDVAAREAAASGMVGRRGRQSAVLDRMRVAMRPGVSPSSKLVGEFVSGLLALRERADGMAAVLSAVPGLPAPERWNPFDDDARAALDQRIERLRWAAAAVDPGGSGSTRGGYVEPLRRALAAGIDGDPAPVAEAASAASALAAAAGTTPAALRSWAGTDGLVPRWWAARQERGSDVGDLRAWLDLLGLVEPLRAPMPEVRAGILACRLDPDDARRSFELGLARASVRERLRRTDLDRFDATSHERSIARFGTVSGTVRDGLVSVLPQRVVAARGIDATSARVGALRRTLGAKRGGMKIRELMTTYGDLVTRALPCVLVSPDSLARFFPAVADQFDVVVFDEASQVRVADAVGAMGRGRSVVVVGDSKQMPPTTFADVGGSDSGDEETGADPLETVEDEESILTECVQAGVASQRLGWHYRSQDEALIAFSNRHYYDGALSSFPAPDRGTRAVSLVRVDGTFHRTGRGPLLRTNPVEARAVVDEVLRRFAASPDRLPSLGVVTFNQQQRAHVEGLLRDLDDPRVVEALEAPEGLFVKNLENVQGDERDVILFSTAFSVNERGVLPMNFGPLNRAGGERRLNVAVTRARRQVVVFCSFDPARMRTEDTSSVGVRHLRSYLELAAHGPSALPRDNDRRARTDRHRDDVAERLRECGLAVRSGVGLSDFTIDLVLTEPSGPGGAAVAVLLDGPGWAGRMTARDRDHLPVEVLARVLGWSRVERVWLPQWLQDPDAVLDHLVRVTRDAARAVAPDAGPAVAPIGDGVGAGVGVDATVRVPSPAAAARSSSVSPEPAHGAPAGAFSGAAAPTPADAGVPAAPAAAPAHAAPAERYVPVAVPGSGGRRRAPDPDDVVAAQQALATAEPSPRAGSGERAEFVPWHPRRLGGREVLDALPDRAAATQVRAALAEVVEAEGPIRVERLAALVAGAFDLTRVSESRRTQILRHLPRDLGRDDVEQVVWPVGVDPVRWTGYRAAGESSPRRFDEVPLREIGNAMVALLASDAGTPRPALYTETLRVFGLLRRTPSAVERLGVALELAEGAGRVTIGHDDTVAAAG